MTTWMTFEGDDSAWDRLINQLGGTSPFATSGWARTKTSGRWNTDRAVSVVEGDVVAAAQVFWLSILGVITIGWIPGGIASNGLLSVTGLNAWFAKCAKTRLVYLRSAFHRPQLVNDEGSLTESGWSKSPKFIGASETFIITRKANGLADSSQLSSNWKRNLQRGLQRNSGASLWLAPDATEIAALMREMVDFKKANGPQAVTTEGSLKLVFTEMQNQIVVVQVRGPEGKLQAVRGAFVTGDSAWDALAAAGVDARKNYSSYVCAWKLIEELDARGISAFDLAGIDELLNEGVFNFKKGLGGERTVYLGEWDWASTSLARHIARIVISRLG
jgi:hypothetical protein